MEIAREESSRAISTPTKPRTQEGPAEKASSSRNSTAPHGNTHLRPLFFHVT